MNGGKRRKVISRVRILGNVSFDLGKAFGKTW